MAGIRTTDAAFIARLTDAHGPCTAPLDAALEYVRARVDRVLPAYLLAMAPHAVVVIVLVDAIVAGRRSTVRAYCAGLVVATVWRWVWLARLQFDVLHDLRGGPAGGFWSRLPAILIVRLAANVALSWGALFAGVPAFYALFVGGFAAPLLFENAGPTLPRLRECLSWVYHAGRRLFRVTLVMTVVAAVAAVAAFVSQAVLANTILPSLLGVDTADLNLTLGSWAWRLRVLYFLFLALDAYWSVACVFLYYDSQSRRVATDLRVRLLDVTEAAA